MNNDYDILPHIVDQQNSSACLIVWHYNSISLWLCVDVAARLEPLGCTKRWSCSAPSVTLRLLNIQWKLSI